MLRYGQRSRRVFCPIVGCVKGERQKSSRNYTWPQRDCEKKSLIMNIYFLIFCVRWPRCSSVQKVKIIFTFANAFSPLHFSHSSAAFLEPKTPTRFFFRCRNLKELVRTWQRRMLFVCFLSTHLSACGSFVMSRRMIFIEFSSRTSAADITLAAFFIYGCLMLQKLNFVSTSYKPSIKMIFLKIVSFYVWNKRDCS